MFAWQPQFAGIEDAINSHCSLTICTSYVEVRTFYLALTDGLAYLNFSVFLDVLTSNCEEG
jgi:hypothetical protein